MKSTKRFLLAAVWVLLFFAPRAYGQTEVKVNGAYALAGVIDLSVEVPISPRLSLASEFLYSPWESVKLGGHSRPEKFGYVLGELRWYFKKTDRDHHRGWWVSGDLGALVMMKMSRPYYFKGGQFIHWANKYERGTGFLIGPAVGYKWILGEHFTLDAYVGGLFVIGWYNGYFLYDVYGPSGEIVHRKDEIIMKPHRPNQPEIDDPWNGSSNWIPRFGVNVAYKFL